MTLKHGENAAGQIAADANVLLSAATGRAALKVFTHSHLEVVTTSLNIKEVREYLPVMAGKYGIAVELLESQFQLLAVREYEPKEYHGSMAIARRKIGKRDPDDIDLLALSLERKIPIWSNDGDFSGTGIEWYTTARLLKKLGL
ncbi:MAG TPA: PIN domain-containing protein [bacterium]|nr:PIN domain-containing protein [bacterium]